MSSRLPDAIREQRVVEFAYAGGSRSVEPHAVGYDDSGRLMLTGWQLTGKNGPGLRDFAVQSMRLLTVTGRTFDGPRPDYDPALTNLRKVVAKL
jgi:predicted DNA-binding transcriptional regulator YafY